jgi:hypothetical protein
MADLTMNKPRKYRGQLKRGRMPVAANVQVFVGSAMEAHSGGIDNADGGATSDFVGFAAEHVDNRTNAVPHGGAAGAVSANLITAGEVFLTVTKNEENPWLFSDIGRVVYASDGDTFDTTNTGTKIGKVVDLLDAVANGTATEEVIVSFDTAQASLLIV